MLPRIIDLNYVWRNYRSCTCNSDQSVQKELVKTPKDVILYYQKNAWLDTSTCMAYARKFRASTGVQDEKLVGLDNLTAHYTPRFKRIQ